MAIRKIVKIDEENCNGCGQCVSPCAEGAIEIIDGKAKVVREELCDGAGFCIGICPQGALSIEERETVDFDHKAVEEHLKNRPVDPSAVFCTSCGTGDDIPLLPVRLKGESIWVCTKCLPRYIHG
ncbi:ATP-binding protein [Desulfolucanica intricata]|uniref:ATP-binding protein n=1 Tax=Desulfolucanica intricata TaxID=1285191 RepID=UPI0008319649|nr:4Fe-4S binding protein [Desulfolucanica intricata]